MTTERQLTIPVFPDSKLAGAIGRLADHGMRPAEQRTGTSCAFRTASANWRQTEGNLGSSKGHAMRWFSHSPGRGWVRRWSSGGPLRCFNAFFLVAVALACPLAGCVVIHTPDLRPVETDNDQRDSPEPLSPAPVNGPTSISKLPDSRNDATTCARPPQVLVDLVSAESTDDTRTPHNNPSDPRLPADMSGQNSESSDGIHVIPVEDPR